MRYGTCFKKNLCTKSNSFSETKIAVQIIIRKDTVDSMLQNKMSHLPTVESVKIKRILQNNGINLQILKDGINTSDLNPFLHHSVECNQAHESI